MALPHRPLRAFKPLGLRVHPFSDIVDVSKDPPRVFAATFACITTGNMKHDDGAIRYVKWNILPLF